MNYFFLLCDIAQRAVFEPFEKVFRSESAPLTHPRMIRTYGLWWEYNAPVSGSDRNIIHLDYVGKPFTPSLFEQTVKRVCHFIGFGEGSAKIANAGYKKALIAIRFSRTEENEADRMGLELMARVGF